MKAITWIVVFWGVAALPASASTLLVWQGSPNPAPPYANWANAAQSIQQAVDAAHPGDTVLVTNGVYSTGGRAVSGAMTNRVAINQAITVRSLNGPALTMIQGATAPDGTNGDGAIRCAYVGNGAVLSGFTLSNGHTRTSGDWASERFGGGAWCETGGALTNCVLTGNSASEWAGGAYQGTLYDCTLAGNSAFGAGGGASNTLYNCTLATNSANYEAGGAWFCTLSNCALVGNLASSGGGASGSTLYNCTLTGNSAAYEGGGTVSCTLSNCALNGNAAVIQGGGASYSQLMNCTLTGNSATTTGTQYGGMGGGANQSTLQNCTLTGNSAGSLGGGVANATLHNCTLTGNSANFAGGAASSALTNCIVYFNTAEVGPNCDSWSTLSFSCTTPLPTNGVGDIDLDPQMASATHLFSNSPCIAAGSSAYASGVDIDGQPWLNPPCMGADQYLAGVVVGDLAVGVGAASTNVATGFLLSFTARITGRATASAWDFGDGTVISNQPYASHVWVLPGSYTMRLTAWNDRFPAGLSATTLIQVVEPPVYYVNQANATPAFPYTTWETAATTIQDAVGAGKVSGRWVWVADGVYNVGGVTAGGGLTNRVALTNPVIVQSVNGPEVTLIQGAEDPAGGNGPGAIRCAYVGANARLSGFTLAGGHTWTNGAHATEFSGGGACCELGAVLSNCVIRGNSAVSAGGGVYRGTLYNCTLSGNSAASGGGAYGGILSYSALSNNLATEFGGGVFESRLDHCTLTGNACSYDGGGAMGGTLRNCTLTGNTSGQYGGGVENGELHNCTLTGNSAATAGGGAYLGTLYNCTLTGNDTGGGVGYATLYNCLVYFNTAQNWPNHFQSTFSYSCTTPLPLGGPGNLALDPQLASSTHLSASSPCIGAGSAAYSSGVDIDREQWLDPPCIGADQYVPGGATGPLLVAMTAAFTNVAPAFAVSFSTEISGSATSSVWNFGDGTVLSNQPYASHSWAVAGSYPVTLTAYNDSFPAGISTTTVVEVVEGPAYYVDQASLTPAFPYTSWQTAATTIQEAIGAGMAPGRRVWVADGVYEIGAVVVGNANSRVALTNPVVVSSVNGPAVTIIRGSGSLNGGTVRSAYVGGNAILSGFTLTNGHADPNGGGAWCEATGVLTNCVLDGNSAYYQGGGVFGGVLYHCTLNGNSADIGGGAYNSTLYDCTLSGNSTTGTDDMWGDGMGAGASGCTLYRCTLTGNSAGTDGGGTSGSTLYNCTLTGNSARGYGGGTAWSSLFNCVLAGNSAETGGGADGGTLNNCTLTGNAASAAGGGTAGGTLCNCIVYYNTAPSGPNYSWSTLNYCCTVPLPADGAGNIAQDPQLASFSHLSAGSPCIGTGSPACSFGLDIDGEAWLNPPCIGADQFVGGHTTGTLSVAMTSSYTNVALGIAVSFTTQIEGPATASVWDFGDGTMLTNQPYASHVWALPGSYTVRLTAWNDSFPSGVSATMVVQVLLEPVYYVNPANATSLPPYTNWASAATTLQDAIDAAAPGGLVLATNGVYDQGGLAAATGGSQTNRVALTKPLVLQSVNGPAMTMIVGAPGDSSGTGAVRCAFVGDGALLSRFTLTNGHADSGWDWRSHSGGGVLLEAAGVATNCVLAGNWASGEGGGASGGTLYDCALLGNSAYYYGGGAAGSTLYHCTIAGNAAYPGGTCSGGGAIACTLYNCTLTGNSSAWDGGGAAQSTLYNCLLTGNSALFGGGISGGTLYNCTLTGNFTTGYQGGGAHSGELYNCILYYNTAREGSNSYSSTLHYCCTTPLPTNGTGNITKEPGFVNRATGDYHLRYDSPCIDAGTNLSAFLKTDLDGTPRPLDGNGDGLAAFDIGAYEFNPLPFRILAISNGPPVSVFFLGSPSQLYTLFCCTNLAGGGPAASLRSGVPGQTDVPGRGGLTVLQDTNPGPARFYGVGVRGPQK